MAFWGHKFTVDEILRLGNPTDNYGNTIAHTMACWGHEFTVDEILQLGDPVGIEGQTIAHQMEENGYKFSIKENFMLTSGFTNIQEAELAWQCESGENVSLEEVLPYPVLLEKYADRLV
jgi:hypothetical protein